MMKASPSPRGCLAVLLPIFLAVCAVAISAKHQYPADPTCGGMLGAGFPVLFICDDWGGGSPSSSWDKIDYVDVLNGGVKPASFLIDLLFYTVLTWSAWYIVTALAQGGRVVRATYSWATWISIGYILGLLTGYLIFHPNALGLEQLPVRKPTPVMPSPTPLVNRSLGPVPLAGLAEEHQKYEEAE